MASGPSPLSALLPQDHAPSWRLPGPRPQSGSSPRTTPQDGTSQDHAPKVAPPQGHAPKVAPPPGPPSPAGSLPSTMTRGCSGLDALGFLPLRGFFFCSLVAVTVLGTSAGSPRGTSASFSGADSCWPAGAPLLDCSKWPNRCSAEDAHDESTRLKTLRPQKQRQPPLPSSPAELLC